MKLSKSINQYRKPPRFSSAWYWAYHNRLAVCCHNNNCWSAIRIIKGIEKVIQYDTGTKRNLWKALWHSNKSLRLLIIKVLKMTLTSKTRVNFETAILKWYININMSRAQHYIDTIDSWPQRNYYKAIVHRLTLPFFFYIK